MTQPSYRDQIRESLRNTEVDLCRTELKFNTHSEPEFEITLATWGHRLLGEFIGHRECHKHNTQPYTIWTRGETFTTTLPEHARRVGEARRQIEFDFQRELETETKTQMQLEQET